MLKVIDGKTGRITLCGTGAERLAQATAAGLVSGELKQDVEAVSARTRACTGRWRAASAMRGRRSRRASQLRREKLDGYLREHVVRESRRTLREIGWGWFCLGVAVGASLMIIAAAMML